LIGPQKIRNPNTLFEGCVTAFGQVHWKQMLTWVNTEVTRTEGSCDTAGAERRTILLPNYYLQEQLLQAHREELLRQAEQRRLLAHLPRDRQRLARALAGKLGVVLIALDTSLQRLEPKRKPAM